MPYVFSTLTSDQNYTFYTQGGADLQIPERGILIKGGTGVMNDRLITPIGVATEVTDEQLKLLEKHPIFIKHKQNGYISVQEKKADAEKVAGDMKTQDGSSPLTPASFKGDGDNPETLKATTNKGK